MILAQFLELWTARNLNVLTRSENLRIGMESQQTGRNFSSANSGVVSEPDPFKSAPGAGAVHNLTEIRRDLSSAIALLSAGAGPAFAFDGVASWCWERSGIERAAEMRRTGGRGTTTRIHRGVGTRL